MVIRVRFYIKVNTEFFAIVTEKLKSIGVNVKSFRNDPSNLVGTVYIPTNQPLKVIDLMNVYYQIEGVIRINVDYEPEGDKRSWYRHPTIPVLIRTVILAATIFGILYGLRVTVDFERFVVIIVISSIVSFFTGIVNKYFE